jgi:hypothetical protein
MPTPSPQFGGDQELSPDLRDYLIACVRAARPSRSRADALRLLGAIELETDWELPPTPVDWDEVEAEARRQGCTVADVLYDRAGRRPDPDLDPR